MANRLLTKLAFMANLQNKMITVNSKALNKWIHNTEDGMSKLMQTTGLSFHTIDRMRRGKYASEPYRATRKAICSATGIAEQTLFPVSAEKKIS